MMEWVVTTLLDVPHQLYGNPNEQLLSFSEVEVNSGGYLLSGKENIHHFHHTIHQDE